MIFSTPRRPSPALAHLLFCAAIALSAAACGGDGVPEEPPPLPTYDYPLDDVLRLNHIQMKGTHNSYHIAPEGAIDDWRYTHAPLDIQLAAQGVRKVELDTHYN